MPIPHSAVYAVVALLSVLNLRCMDNAVRAEAAQTASRSSVSQPSPSLPDQWIVSPKSNGEVQCLSTTDGLYTFTVVGGSRSPLKPNTTLLLWVRPVSPPGDGWYLQRPPVGGIGSVEADGWEGTGQIGDRRYPPHNGDRFELRITALESRAAEALLNDRIVFRTQPIGRAVAAATNLKVARQ
jgi:hypothetical protein